MATIEHNAFIMKNETNLVTILYDHWDWLSEIIFAALLSCLIVRQALAEMAGTLNVNQLEFFMDTWFHFAGVLAS